MPSLEEISRAYSLLALNTSTGAEPSPSPALSLYLILCSLFLASVYKFWPQSRSSSVVSFLVLAGFPLTLQLPCDLSFPPSSLIRLSSLLVVIFFPFSRSGVLLPLLIQLKTRAKHIGPRSRILHNLFEDSVALKQYLPQRGNFHVIRGDLLQGQTSFRNLSWGYNPGRFSLKARRKWWENIS